MSYGFASFDAQGKANNYGIKPISVASSISLAQGQNSGTWTFTVPAGHKLGFIEIPVAFTEYSAQRSIEVSGNSIVVKNQATGNYITYANAAMIIVYIEVI